MSHMTVMETLFTELDCLLAALQKVQTRTGPWTKNKIEIHDKPVDLYGYDGQLRPQKGNLVIRRQWVGSASNDLAFTKNKTTGCYDAVISDYDRNYYNSKWMDGLKQGYATEVAKKYAPAGYSLQETTVGENIHMVYVRNY